MTLRAEPLTVGIVGAGTMGAGIAQVCLQAGHRVILHDVADGAVERARLRIAAGLSRLVAKEGLSDANRGEALRRLEESETVADLARRADVTIEAALEDLELKRTLFAEIDRHAPPDALLSSNTSALSIDAIAAATAHPGRVLGLHFFNPAPLMALVEVVAGSQTAARTVRSGLEFAVQLGKTPVACDDTPGFIVNRVNRPFTLEALRMLEAGEASVAVIDAAVTEAGYPMGPFALMDLVGIDVNLAVASAIWHAFDEEARFRPSPIQTALVEAGALGRKTGCGFYTYDAHGSATGITSLPPGIPTVVGEQLASDEIVPRLELAIINEAYHAAGEAVADPPDIDVAMRLGAGHPYGPFERARQLGLGNVVRGLRRNAERYGARYAVAPALWQIASV